MILTIYKRALGVLLRKPFALWGISLLKFLLVFVLCIFFLGVPGVGIAINILIGTAMTMIFLRGYRGEEVHTAQLFDCFKDGATAKRVLGGMLWVKLWIFLWSLIPIVGIVFNIVKTYEYRLTPYILVTEPEISATEAMKESSKRTKGYKGKMFGADILIPVIVALIQLILGLFAKIPFIGSLFNLILIIFTICWTILSPLYTGLVQAAFYEEIKNPTIPAYSPRPRYNRDPYARDPYAAPQDPYAIPGGYQEPQAGTHCPHCGAPLPPNSVFCTNCGTRLG